MFNFLVTYIGAYLIIGFVFAIYFSAKLFSYKYLWINHNLSMGLISFFSSIKIYYGLLSFMIIIIIWPIILFTLLSKDIIFTNKVTRFIGLVPDQQFRLLIIKLGFNPKIIGDYQTLKEAKYALLNEYNKDIGGKTEFHIYNDNLELEVRRIKK